MMPKKSNIDHCTMGRKAGCTWGKALRRVLFLSPIFLTILLFFWAAVLRPLSTSLLRVCSKKDADCMAKFKANDFHVQSNGFTDTHFHRLPLNLEESDGNWRRYNTVPDANHFIDIVKANGDRKASRNRDNPSANAGAADHQANQEEPNSNMVTQEASNENHHLQQIFKTGEEVAAEEVQKLMEDLRRTASYHNDSYLILSGVDTGRNPSCEGKRVFIYDLPSKFNADLFDQCHQLIPWFNMCDYVSNSGMGKVIEDHTLQEEGSEEVLVPEGHWYQTHQYSLEIIFHERLKQYPCLVTNPQHANLFYIPYYGGLDVLRWHFVENVSNSQRDELGLELISWLKEQPTWGKNNGADHVLVLGKISWDFRRWPNGDGWGSSLLLQEEMQNLSKLLIERQPWHEHDVGVPHPTFFHPRHDRDIRTWQGHIDGAKRRHLVSFAGQPRPEQTESIRSHLISQCVNSNNGSINSSCYFLHCRANACLQPNTTMHLFMHSEFCLQPPGDSPTRRSIFDSLIAGCIPVLFDPYSAYYQYPWHLPADPTTYSVYFPANDVREGKINVIEELRKIPRSVRDEIRLRIIYDIMPGLVYAKPGARLREVEDAFLISLRSLFSRVFHRLNNSFAVV